MAAQAWARGRAVPGTGTQAAGPGRAWAVLSRVVPGPADHARPIWKTLAAALVGGTSACTGCPRRAGPSHPAPPDLLHYLTDRRSPLRRRPQGLEPPRQGGRCHLPDPDSREGVPAAGLGSPSMHQRRRPRGRRPHLHQCRPSIYRRKRRRKGDDETASSAGTGSGSGRGRHRQAVPRASKRNVGFFFLTRPG